MRSTIVATILYLQSPYTRYTYIRSNTKHTIDIYVCMYDVYIYHCTSDYVQCFSKGLICMHAWVYHAIVDTIGTQLGVPNSEVDLHTTLCGWDSRHCPH